jgi:thioredoxin reductase
MSIADVAIVGAGPYGLSIAAYLRERGLRVRVFGRPMNTWLEHMPKGMCLKSEGFASALYDPHGELTLKKFCRDAGIEYADVGVPVALDTFSAYGLAFAKAFVPDLDEREVARVSRAPSGGFDLLLDDGETVQAARLIVAVGISHFEYVPSELSALPADLLAHSSRDRDYSYLKGKSVAVVGAGASAVDVAVALHEAGAAPELVARTSRLAFHEPPVLKRSIFSRIRYPRTGLGCGLKSRFFTDMPDAFSLLPPALRSRAVATQLGPAPCWFTKERFVRNVRTHLGVSIERSEVRDGRVALHLRDKDGASSELVVDHAIAATGYRVDLTRLRFLSDDLRASIRVFANAPVLTRNFESSLSGLFFVGLSAANTFGPLLRFAYGARFAATRLRSHLSRNGQLANG